MAILDSTNDFGKRLCEALKLDPKKTRDIMIDVPVDDLVMVYASLYLQKEESEEVLLILKEYELHEKVVKENGLEGKTS